jgi:8-oxo-dGTP pyrophosphatase MutT (NUDIX family)
MPTVGAHIVFHRLLKTSKKDGSPLVRAVLLTKRTLDAPIHPGYWGLVGGKLKKPDESPECAACREAQEELGVQLEPSDVKLLCDVKIEHDASGPSTISYFSAALSRDMDELTLQRNYEKRVEGEVEGEGLGWFTAEEIHHIMVRPEDRIAISAFFQEYGI